VTDSLLCRVCSCPMTISFVNLGMIPLCQHYIEPDQVETSETFYPLHARVCPDCFYVGLPEYVSAQEIFTEYAYFSSISTSWLSYVKDSVASMVELYSLNAQSQVIEMASNDGYLLQFFVERGIPALGVEPAMNVAKVANDKGIPTLAEFFNLKTALELRERGGQADLLLAFNCLDHVPDLQDVLKGMQVLLKPEGVIHVELPYLRSLVEDNQFDTIYHDRYSYFSLMSASRAFARNGLRIFDVKRIPTHGGSLRILACHAENRARPTLPSVSALLVEEEGAGMATPEFYRSFTRRVADTKHQLLRFLIDVKSEGHSLVGYGVAAKGNVLLNYCGIRGDFIDYLVDRSPYKRGKYAPGTRLPIQDVEQIFATKPAYILILPWNIKDEIVQQMASVRAWGGKFVVAIPRIQTL
jgi:SAM-dependent methyltransferase